MPRRSSAPRIVVVGSANTDLIVRVPRLPGPGETILGGEFRTAAGGKGANQAVAAARAGASVAFVGRVGTDSFGDAMRAGLAREGLSLGHLQAVRGGASGVALITVGASGENAIAVAGGANEALTPADVRRARGVITQAAVLLVQLETPLATVAEAVRIASAAGVRVILNPAPARKLPAALLRNVDFLTPNEHEAALLAGVAVTGAASAAKAAAVLRRGGARGVVITLGALGAYVSAPGLEALIPGFRARAVDTTAAGDVFNGAFAVRLAEGAALADAIRFAHAAAAISVTRSGAQPSIPRRREIDTFLACHS